MTEEQQAALDKIMAVKCKIKAQGCGGGDWCVARKAIADAFDLKFPKPEPKPETKEDK
jgi:hypothetical protein